MADGAAGMLPAPLRGWLGRGKLSCLLRPATPHKSFNCGLSHSHVCGINLLSYWTAPSVHINVHERYLRSRTTIRALNVLIPDVSVNFTVPGVWGWKEWKWDNILGQRKGKRGKNKRRASVGSQPGVVRLRKSGWNSNNAASSLRRCHFCLQSRLRAAGRRESVPAVNKRQPWLNGSGNELKMETKSGRLPLRRVGGMTPVPHVHQNNARMDTFVRCWVEISLNQNRRSMVMTVFPACAPAHSLQWMKYPRMSKLPCGPAGHQVPPAMRYYGSACFTAPNYILIMNIFPVHRLNFSFALIQFMCPGLARKSHLYAKLGAKLAVSQQRRTLTGLKSPIMAFEMSRKMLLFTCHSELLTKDTRASSYSAKYFL